MTFYEGKVNQSMWGAAGVVFVAVIIAWMEVPSLIRLRFYRELIVFSVVLVFGVSVAIAKMLRLPVPNPNDWVASVLGPFGEVIQNMLK